LGDWSAHLYACTPGAEVSVKRFSDHFHSILISTNDAESTENCLLVDALSWFLEGEYVGWKYPGVLAITDFPFSKVCLLSQPLSQQFRPEQGSNVDKLIYSKQRELFDPSILVVERSGEYLHLQIYLYSLLLATYWHVERGGFCVHSSAVARGNSGFLFVGESGAGKTTIAQLSTLIGYSALGDDLNFVISENTNTYRLVAVPSPKLSPAGYSSLQPTLQGVFKLVQDCRDYLVPLSSMQTACILYDSFRQVPKTNLFSGNVFGLVLKTVASIARQVPGYELHFRKSPDFWKLIDERFSG
jgi:hypothetical protein